MGLSGLVDPSALLLGDRRRGVPGSIAVPVLEGRRHLSSRSRDLSGRRRPESRGGWRKVSSAAGSHFCLPCSNGGATWLSPPDVFVSTVGGLRVSEPAAIWHRVGPVSAVTGIAIGEEVVACVRSGWPGELRRVQAIERRLAEAARLGFAVLWCRSPPPRDDRNGAAQSRYPAGGSSTVLVWFCRQIGT